MPKGTVQLTFNNKKRYKYPIEVSNPTEPEIAIAVSKRILESQVKKGMKRQSGGLPCYNLVTDLLRKQNIRYNLPEPIASDKEQAFLKAKLANESSPFIETKCTECNGERTVVIDVVGDQEHGGYPIEEKCPKCNGHGVVYARTVYRVGKNTDRQLIVESDSTSPDNAKLIHEHLTKLFGYRFHIVKTTHGYHFVGTQIYPTSDAWVYANCKVLKPNITVPECFGRYIDQLIGFDSCIRDNNDGQANKHLFEDRFKTSDLYNGVGNFDVLYTVLSIKYKKSTLRISKKHKDDKYEEVK